MDFSLIIYCDGGLGNRLNSLYGGLAVAQELQLNYIVAWPKNRWCNASLSDLFDHNLNVIDDTLPEISEKYSSAILISHDNQLLENLYWINPKNHLTFKSFFFDIRRKVNKYPFVIYHNSLIPHYLFDDAISIGKQKIRFKKETKELGEYFLRENKLNNKYIALHIRGTDYGLPIAYINFLYLLLRLLRKKTLLCSDDKNVIDKFSQLSNVFSRSNISLPSKIIMSEHYRVTTEDEYGRKFEYNINRDNQSVVESITDLYLLSKGIKPYTSRSTFLAHAYIFSNSLLCHIIKYSFIFSHLKKMANKENLKNSR